MNQISLHALKIDRSDFKISLFGTGIGLGKFIEEMNCIFYLSHTNKKIEDCIDKIVDNSLNKQGEALFGRTVESPDNLQRGKKSTYIIVTASSFYAPIKKQLKEKGLFEYKDFLSGDLYISILLKYYGIIES